MSGGAGDPTNRGCDMSAVRSSSCRLILGVALALVGMAYFSPSAARAECGDYVVMGQHLSAHSSLSGAQVPLPAQAGDRAGSQHKPKPCPFCHRCPGFPPAAPAEVTLVQGGEWACLTSGSDTAHSEASPLSADSQPFIRTAVPGSIYRPPR